MRETLSAPATNRPSRGLRPPDRGRGAQRGTLGPRANTPSTPNAPPPSARWPPISSTSCSSRPRRTTATRRVFRLCWNCWTINGSPAPSPINRTQLEAVMVRRMKSELELRWDGSRRFAKRRVLHLEVRLLRRPSAAAHQALREYARLRAKSAATEGQRFATEFVLKLLKKRLFSSPAAFAITLEKHARSVGAATRRRAGAGCGSGNLRTPTTTISPMTTITSPSPPKPWKPLPGASPLWPGRKPPSCASSASSPPTPPPGPTAKPAPSSAGSRPTSNPAASGPTGASSSSPNTAPRRNGSTTCSPPRAWPGRTGC